MDKYTIGSTLFVKGIALVYLLAFTSLWLQIEALFGPQGIMPINRYFELNIEADELLKTILQHPSLLWLNLAIPIESMSLHIICGCGALFSILSMFNLYRGISLSVCWFLYLSLVSIGSPFLNFQWDNLLLESGFLAVFLSGFHKQDNHPSSFIHILIRLLLFRLMFFSGLVKLASDDPAWWNLTALFYHFETQPLPHALSWYFHQLPFIMLKIGTAVMFVIELLAPFFIFLGTRLRTTAGILFIALMLLISLSGNYTYFNLLTLILCLTLFENRFYQRLFPGKMISHFESQKYSIDNKINRFTQITVMIIIICLTLITESRRWLPIHQVSIISQVSRFIYPYRIVNTYGLFSVMTKTRPEIIFELSPDGENWEELEFKWKPVNLDQKPGWIQPHQPRLDWQLWFAGLYYDRVLSVFQQHTGRSPGSYNEINSFIYRYFRQTYSRHIWVHNLMDRILLENRQVVKIITGKLITEKNKYIRAWLYDYSFTSSDAEKWWKRKNKRLLFPAFRMKDKTTE